MTDMKRLTVSFPDEINDAIYALRKTDEFSRCSYSEIIRRLVQRALDQQQSASSRAAEGDSIL